MNQDYFKNMSIDELKAYIEEQKPIEIKKMNEAYKASDVHEFQRLSKLACEPICRANMQLRKITTDIVMQKHDDIGDLMTFEDFKEYCKSGALIDYDGFGKYSTKEEESNIEIMPLDIEEGVYRTDFTHVMWYNR